MNRHDGWKQLTSAHPLRSRPLTASRFSLLAVVLPVVKLSSLLSCSAWSSCIMAVHSKSGVEM